MSRRICEINLESEAAKHAGSLAKQVIEAEHAVRIAQEAARVLGVAQAEAQRVLLLTTFINEKLDGTPEDWRFAAQQGKLVLVRVGGEDPPQAPQESEL